MQVQGLALGTRGDLSKTLYLHVLGRASTLFLVVFLTHASKWREYQAGSTCPEAEVVWSIIRPVRPKPFVGLVGIINVTKQTVCLVDGLDVYLMKV